MQEAERARKNEAAILNGLVKVGQKTVSEALRVDESTISRFKDRDIARFSLMLAVLGFKIVPQEMRCFDPDDVELLFRFTKKRLAKMESSDDLLPWGEDPE